MATPNSLRCLFASTTTPARNCLRRQLHSSIRLYQGADDAPEPLKGKGSTGGSSTTVGSDNSSGLRDSDPLPKRKKLTKLDPRPAPPATISQTDLTPEQAVVLKGLKSYSKKDKAKLRTVYTPVQFAALEAGEEAVDPHDIAQQAALREDPMAFEYFDDFSKIHPVIDKAVKAPEENYDPKLRYKNEDEIAEDFAKFVQTLPNEPSRLDYIKFRDNLRLTVGKEEAERNPRSSMAPEIPKGLAALQRPGMKVGEADVDPAMKRLMRQTGFSLDEIRRFRVKNLVVHRVVNQTRMGKIQSMYYLTVAGNGRGLLGIGEGKSTEAEDARRQAHFNAIRNVQPIPRYEDRTIFGDVRVKIGAVELELMTRPPGFGIRCQAYIFEMCRCAGISDLAARVTRSRNPMNTIKATFQALLNQRLPDEIARGLGKKLVDVRRVYYGGQV